MINCRYGANNKFIDVNNIVLAKFRKKDMLQFPSGNKYLSNLFHDVVPGTIKTLIVNIRNDEYHISEYDIDEYNIKLPIYCEYGGDDTFINITNNILINFVKDDDIYLNGDKKFNTYFGDPCLGTEKVLRIYVNDLIYEIPECDTDEYTIKLPNLIIEHSNKIKEIMYDDNLITFIIPTINRESLLDTLDSLLQQIDHKWKAICVFDRVEPSQEIQLKLESDIRFDYIVLSEKLGQLKNSAGLVRNVGIERVTTKWVGFVDDDDTLSPYYVNCLKDELINNDVDCIIFRMLYTKIMPLPFHTDFHRNLVGISFCYKTKLFFEGYQFVPSSGEDHDLLNRFRENGIKIMISPHITYKVRNYDTNIKNINKYCMRSFIN